MPVRRTVHSCDRVNAMSVSLAPENTGLSSGDGRPLGRQPKSSGSAVRLGPSRDVFLNSTATRLADFLSSDSLAATARSDSEDGCPFASVLFPAVAEGSGASGVRLVHRLRPRGREALFRTDPAVGPSAQRGRAGHDRHDVSTRPPPSNTSTGPTQPRHDGVDELPSERPVSVLTVLVSHRLRRTAEVASRVPWTPARAGSSPRLRCGQGPAGRAMSADRFR